ncbi:hypothetical protein IWZ00DRAFT_12685 [Phyllosticta capitalensis]
MCLLTNSIWFEASTRRGVSSISTENRLPVFVRPGSKQFNLINTQPQSTMEKMAKDSSNHALKKVSHNSPDSSGDPPKAPSELPSKIRPIPHFPNEIIDQILSFCDLGQRRKSTLMSARLASRAFEKAACRYLFKEVHMDLIGGWGATEFYDIADSRFARHVKHLVMISFLPGVKIIEDIQGPTLITELEEEYSEDLNPEHLEQIRKNMDGNWIFFLDSIKKLPNIRSVSWSNPYGVTHDYSNIDLESEASDDMLTFTLLALSKPPYGSDRCRTLETIEWQGGRKNSWTALSRLCQASNSASSDCSSGDSKLNNFSSEPRSSNKWLPFRIARSLTLIDTTWPRESEFKDENVQYSPSKFYSS